MSSSVARSAFVLGSVDLPVHLLESLDLVHGQSDGLLSRFVPLEICLFLLLGRSAESTFSQGYRVVLLEARLSTPRVRRSAEDRVSTIVPHISGFLL